MSARELGRDTVRYHEIGVAVRVNLSLRVSEMREGGDAAPIGVRGRRRGACQHASGRGCMGLATDSIIRPAQVMS